MISNPDFDSGKSNAPQIVTRWNKYWRLQVRILTEVPVRPKGNRMNIVTSIFRDKRTTKTMTQWKSWSKQEILQYVTNAPEIPYNDLDPWLWFEHSQGTLTFSLGT